MSGNQGGQEKTEQATPQKLKQAREEGNVPRSPDLGGWASVAAGVALTPWTLSVAQDRFGGFLHRLADVAESPEPEVAVGLLGHGLLTGALVAAPIAGACALAVVVGGGVQGGLGFAPKALQPKWQRLNPIQGAKQHYGPTAWWQALQTAVKTAVLVLVTVLAVRDITPIVQAAGTLPLSASVEAARGAVADLVMTSVVVGLLLGVVDYLVRRRKRGRDLRMTKQEVKEELRNSEGDPWIRAARRSRAVALTRNRMMSDVATADAVLVNPTHVAVALRYEASRGAPRVVAKGAGHLAARIRARAAEHGVPMVRDVALARALHRSCRVGDEIPAELYGAVAQVLAFLLSLRRTRRRAPDRPLTVPRPRRRHHRPALPLGE
ncbi:MAG: flagellar biosynthesis protein FlhB [Kineosporiaceae bacterium]